MLVATITGADAPAEPLSVVQSIRLLQALSAVPDPRGRRGRRHSLQSMLLIAVSAVVGGARSYSPDGGWGALPPPAGGGFGRPPHSPAIPPGLHPPGPRA